MLELYNQGQSPHNVEESAIAPVMSPAEMERCREIIRGLRMKDELVRYIRQITTATRDSEDLMVGAGPRGGIHLLLASKAVAALAGRDFVTPDDIKAMAPSVLRHRMVLQPEAEAAGLTTDNTLTSILNRVEVPR